MLHNNPYTKSIVAITLARMELATAFEFGAPLKIEGTLNDLIRELDDLREYARLLAIEEEANG